LASCVHHGGVVAPDEPFGLEDEHVEGFHIVVGAGVAAAAVVVVAVEEAAVEVAAAGNLEHSLMVPLKIKKQ
jgi:hypothetical protein